MKNILIILIFGISLNLFGQIKCDSIHNSIHLTFQDLETLTQNKRFLKSIIDYGKCVELKHIDATFLNLRNDIYDDKKASIAIKLYAFLGENWKFDENIDPNAPQLDSAEEFVEEIENINNNLIITMPLNKLENSNNSVQQVLIQAIE